MNETWLKRVLMLHIVTLRKRGIVNHFFPHLRYMGVATHRGTYSPFSTAMHDLEKVNQHEIFFLPWILLRDLDSRSDKD